jgi:hypothetical protein
MNVSVVLYSRYSTRDAYEPQNALFLSLTRQDLYFSHFYFSFFDDGSNTDICDTESLENILKFSLTLHWLLFTYDICLSSLSS